MNGPASASPALPTTRVTPPQVDSAQQFCFYASGIRFANQSSPFEGASGTERELSKNEQATYDAALDVLRTYFTGENLFGEAVPVSNPQSDDDDTDLKVPAEA